MLGSVITEAIAPRFMNPCQLAKLDCRLTIGPKQKTVHPRAGTSGVELIIEELAEPVAHGAPQECVRSWIDSRLEVVQVEIEVADLEIARTKPEVDRPRVLVDVIVTQKAVVEVDRPAQIQGVGRQRRSKGTQVLQIGSVLLASIYVQVACPKARGEKSHEVTVARRCLTARA